jgi:hypothetical protein
VRKTEGPEPFSVKAIHAFMPERRLSPATALMRHEIKPIEPRDSKM